MYSVRLLYYRVESSRYSVYNSRVYIRTVRDFGKGAPLGYGIFLSIIASSSRIGI